MNSISPEVQRFSEIAITGDVVPSQFVQKIRIKTRTGSKPDLMGAHLLSNIIYWYRPAKIIDEITGQVIGWKNKFKGDYLQRSYSQIAEFFGVCKKTAQRVVDRLVEAGLLKKIVVEKLKLKGGRVLSNVMYLIPIPHAIRNLMSGESKPENNPENTPDPMDKVVHTPMDKVVHTYTENTDTKTFPFSNNPLQPSFEKEGTEWEPETVAKKQVAEPKPVTMETINETEYPLTAMAMANLQGAIDATMKEGVSLNLYLTEDNQLSVLPRHLDEIEINMEYLTTLIEDEEEIPQGINNILIATYNRRLKKRDRPANFAMIAGVGMSDYAGMVEGAEMFSE